MHNTLSRNLKYDYKISKLDKVLHGEKKTMIKENCIEVDIYLGFFLTTQKFISLLTASYFIQITVAYFITITVAYFITNTLQLFLDVE
jgi:hypothetical protein